MGIGRNILIELNYFQMSFNTNFTQTLIFFIFQIGIRISVGTSELLCLERLLLGLPASLSAVLPFLPAKFAAARHWSTWGGLVVPVDLCGRLVSFYWWTSPSVLFPERIGSRFACAHGRVFFKFKSYFVMAFASTCRVVTVVVMLHAAKAFGAECAATPTVCVYI